MKFCPDCGDKLSANNLDRCSSCGSDLGRYLPRMVGVDPSRTETTPVEALDEIGVDEDSASSRADARPGNSSHATTSKIEENPNDPSSDPHQRRRQAEDPQSPVALLFLLAADADPATRGAVAANASAPSRALEALAEDTDDQVRYWAARNPALPAETAARLAGDEVVFVRAGLAQNPVVPAAVIALLAQDSSALVRQRARESPLFENSMPSREAAPERDLVGVATVAARDEADQTGGTIREGAKAIAVGYSHCLAIAADDTVVAWGSNDDGQLDVPRATGEVVAIAAGAYHSLALRKDGTVVAWGEWNHGCTDVPADLEHVTAIAAGRDFSLALKKDGTVAEWGHVFPEEAHIAASLTDVVAIATDVGNRLALRADGSVVIWGALMRGQTPPERLVGARSVGVGWEHAIAVSADGEVIVWAAGRTENAATVIPRPLRTVASIATFGSDCLAILEDGSVVAWGADHSDNIKVPNDLRDVETIAISNGCAMALRIDGSIVVWGRSNDGQHDIPERLLVRKARPDEERVIQVATGLEHSLALRADGTLIAWGGNSSGQTDIPAGLSGVTAIAACWLQSIALKGDGTVVTWGDSERRAPVPVGLTDVIAVSAGRAHYLALKRNGTVVAWGYDDERIKVPAGLTDVVAIAAGGDQNVALKRDGTIATWGDSRFGGLKLTTSATDLVSVVAGLHPGMSQHFVGLTRSGEVKKVAATTFNEEGDVPNPMRGITSIAAGAAHTIAVQSDGTVVAWGSGAHAQLDVPIGLADVVSVAAHTTHNLALTADGTIVGWGTNKSGALAVPAEFRPLVKSDEHQPETSASDVAETVVELAPIVEANDGRASFLRGTGSEWDPFHVSWRDEPFPELGSLERVQIARRAMADNEWEHYGHGRASSNLAAAYTASGRLDAALRSIQEAENRFIDMLNSRNPYPEDLTWMGLAIARYNASYIFFVAGDAGRNLEYAEVNRRAAREALGEITVRSNSWGLVSHAVESLSTLAVG